MANSNVRPIKHIPQRQQLDAVSKSINDILARLQCASVAMEMSEGVQGCNGAARALTVVMGCLRDLDETGNALDRALIAGRQEQEAAHG